MGFVVAGFRAFRFGVYSIDAGQYGSVWGLKEYYIVNEIVRQGS